MSRGALYIATGETFIAEAETSAEQLREVMPDLDIGIMADEEPQSDAFTDFIKIENPEYDFVDKIAALPDSPYDKTLYLDSDIYVAEPIGELFDVLGEWDIAAALDAHQLPILQRDDHQAPGIYGEYDPVPEFNTGVLAYKTNWRVKECMEIWLENYSSEAHWAGQPSFIPGIVESDARICPLPRRYNYIPGLHNNVTGTVKVLHTRLQGGPDPIGKDLLDPDQIPQLLDRVNSRDDPRVTYPRNWNLEHFSDLETRPAAPLWMRVLITMQNRGIGSTIKSFGRKFVRKVRN